MNQELEAFKTQALSKANRAKWIVGAGIAVVAGPLLFAVATTLLGAAAVGIAAMVAGAVAITGIHMYAVVRDRIANKAIQLQMEEAARNPIPTLWREWEKDENEISEFENKIVEYDTEIQAVEQRMRDLTQDMLPEDLKRFSDDVALMRHDLQDQENELAQLRVDHAEEEREIKRASAIWDMGMAMEKANKANPNSQAIDVIARIKRETALDSVNRKTAEGKARLKARINKRMTAAQAGSKTLAIEKSDPQIIELAPVREQSYAHRQGE